MLERRRRGDNYSDAVGEQAMKRELFRISAWVRALRRYRRDRSHEPEHQASCWMSSIVMRRPGDCSVPIATPAQTSRVPSRA